MGQKQDTHCGVMPSIRYQGVHRRPPLGLSAAGRHTAAAHLGVALSVLEQSQEELTALLWPAPLPSGGALLLRLRCAPDAPAEAVEGDHSPALLQRSSFN